MKMLKKLALVSAISMISAGAFAMEAMDDESMAAATGQDGITILVKPGVISDTQATNMGVSTATQNLIDNAAQGYYANSDDSFAGLSIGTIVVHDDDGLGATGLTGNSGALVIGGGRAAVDLNGDGDTLDAGEAIITALKDRTVLLADGSSPIKIDVDMVGDIDGAGAGGAMLNVKITTPRLAIKTGDIYVANSNSAEAGRLADGTASALALEVDGTTHSDKIKIMSGLELVMGAATTTIQLGSESQGHMVVANTTLVGGLTINNLEVFDAGGTVGALGSVVTTGGSFFASSLSIKDAGGSDLSVISNVDIGSTNTNVFANAAPAVAGIDANADGDFLDVGDTAPVAAVIASAPTLTNVQNNVVVAANIPGVSTYAGLLTAVSGAAAGSTAATAAAGVGGATAASVAAAVAGNPVVAATAAAAAGVSGATAADVATAVATLSATLAGAVPSVDTNVASIQTSTQKAYNGLVIEMAQFGHATNGADLAINNIRLGDATAATLGDVQILGLNINGTVAIISGH